MKRSMTIHDLMIDDINIERLLEHKKPGAFIDNKLTL